MGLHVGEVAYGNVGGQKRLDFTVLGPAVNYASRLQNLAKRLGRPVLISSDVREPAVASRWSPPARMRCATSAARSACSRCLRPREVRQPRGARAMRPAGELALVARRKRRAAACQTCTTAYCRMLVADGLPIWRCGDRNRDVASGADRRADRLAFRGGADRNRLLPRRREHVGLSEQSAPHRRRDRQAVPQPADRPAGGDAAASRAAAIRRDRLSDRAVPVSRPRPLRVDVVCDPRGRWASATPRSTGSRWPQD